MAHRTVLFTQEHPNEWRIICNCGWTEKADTKVRVDARWQRHRRNAQQTR